MFDILETDPTRKAHCNADAMQNPMLLLLNDSLGKPKPSRFPQPFLPHAPSTSRLRAAKNSASHRSGFSGSSIASLFIPSSKYGVTCWFRYTRVGEPWSVGCVGGAMGAAAGCGEPRAGIVVGGTVVVEGGAVVGGGAGCGGCVAGGGVEA